MKSLFAVIAVLGLSSVAFAQESESIFANVDTNANGSVGWEEFKLAYPQIDENTFRSIDENHDGVLSPDEFVMLVVKNTTVSN